MDPVIEEEFERIRKTVILSKQNNLAIDFCRIYVNNSPVLYRLQKVLGLLNSILYDRPIECAVCKRNITTPIKGWGYNLITGIILSDKGSTAVDCIINKLNVTPPNPNYMFNEDLEDENLNVNSIDYISEFVENMIYSSYNGKMVCYTDEQRIIDSTRLYVKQRGVFNSSFVKGWTMFMEKLKAKEEYRRLSKKMFIQLTTMSPIGPLFYGGIEYQRVAVSTMYRQL